jgi:hypothetical protein
LPKEEVSDNANTLGGRFVLAVKDEGTDKEVWKARFVVQGYRDHLKTSLVHDTATSRQHSYRVLVGLAAIFGFNLFSIDVTQAFYKVLKASSRRLHQADEGILNGTWTASQTKSATTRLGR